MAGQRQPELPHGGAGGGVSGRGRDEGGLPVCLVRVTLSLAQHSARRFVVVIGERSGNLSEPLAMPFKILSSVSGTE